MNNTFQINRFSKLVKRTFVIHKRTWITFAFIAIGIPILMFLSNIVNIDTFSIEQRGFSPFAVIYLLMFTPFILFYHVNHPKRGITEVMLPASTLEKFLNMQLFSIIISPLLIITLYFATDALITLLYPPYLKQFAVVEFIKISKQSLLNDPTASTIVYFSSFFFVAQLFFFLNILFSSNKIIKIVIFYLIISLLFSFIYFFKNSNTINYKEILNTITLCIENTSPYILMIASYLVLKLKRY